MEWYILCSVLLFIYLYNYLKNKRKYDLAAAFPGPSTLPIIGNSLMFLHITPENSLEFINSRVKIFGGIYRVWIGSKLAFMVTDYKIMEIILSSSTKNLTKNSLYEFLIPWLGDGLLLSSGQKWHNRRKIITPAFHFKILENFVKIFDKHSFVLVDKLKNLSNGQIIDIQPYITLYALDVVCETAMGTELNAQTNSNSEYVTAVHDITNVIAERFSNISKRIPIFFKTIHKQMKLKHDQAIDVLHKFTENIIETRRKNLIEEMALSEEMEKNTAPDVDGINKKMALLDILLKSTINGQPLSNADIREEVDTFMFEGHDTTTSGICFTLWLISRHKNVQDKLFNEIQTIIGQDPNRPTTYRELQDLKYMELVIKESLRIYPPVPLIGRNLEEDTILPDKRILPAGSNFTMSFISMFNNPEIFPEPEKFIPERFSIDNEFIDNISPFAYIPFSAGSRNCIGQKFAILEMKSVISKILRHFECLPIGETPLIYPELVLRSKNGIQIGLCPRIIK